MSMTHLDANATINANTDEKWEYLYATPTFAKNPTHLYMRLRFAIGYDLDLNYYCHPDETGSQYQAKYALKGPRNVVLTGSTGERMDLYAAREWAVKDASQQLESLANTAHSLNTALTHSYGWAEAITHMKPAPKTKAAS